jgi:hypothetical protein
VSILSTKLRRLLIEGAGTKLHGCNQIVGKSRASGHTSKLIGTEADRRGLASTGETIFGSAICHAA